MTSFPELVSSYDQKLLINDILAFDKQLTHGIKHGREVLSVLRVLRDTGIADIVMAGMGGSAIGGELANSYLRDRLAQPIVMNRGYGIPGFADEQTLFIASSYSGNTEETLSACRAALSRKCRVVTVSTGGALSKEKGNNLHQIELPGGLMPRAALGYSFSAILFCLATLLDEPARNDVVSDLEETARLVGSKKTEYSPDNEGNAAQEIAIALKGRIPVFYASDRFEAVATRIRNQVNENAKSLAFSNAIPEMNHNEILGWANPLDLVKKSVAVFLRTPDESDRMAKRIDISREIISKETMTLEIRAEGSNPLSHMFSLIYLGDWVSYYLALLNHLDPTPIDAIDFLKQSLS